MIEIQQNDMRFIRRNLTNRHIELKNRLSQVEVDLASSHSQDFADQATEREQDEVLQDEERIFQQELTQIDAAIARIDSGAYGDCVKCGDAIAAARLAVQPEAPFCMKCAS